MEKNMFGERFIVRAGMVRTYHMPSYVSGLRPYHIFDQRLSVFPEGGKHGFERRLRYNEETGVQVNYEVNKLRKFDMSDPIDHKEYWRRRRIVKALYRKMLMEGVNEG